MASSESPGIPCIVLIIVVVVLSATVARLDAASAAAVGDAAHLAEPNIDGPAHNEPPPEQPDACKTR